MQRKWIAVVLVALGVVGLLSGCEGASGDEAAATETMRAIAAPVQQDEGTVAVEAVVEPARWVELRSVAGGAVAEAPVAEGDAVVEGDLLVRFDAADATLAYEIAAATLELAEARLALVQAGPRPEDVAVIEARLDAAEAAIAQAAAQRDQLGGGIHKAQIAAAQAERASAQAQRAQAENLHQRTMTCVTFKLPDGSEEQVCPALGPLEERARSALEAAEAALAAAETGLTAAENRVQTQLRAARSGVAAAVAQRDALRARLERVRAGSTAEQVASAEAQVAQARAALAAAEVALEKTEVRAPFCGTVVDVSVKAGDTAAPGEVVVLLATLDHLLLRATELTELDVARVEPGQSALVTVEALPGLAFEGYVDRVGEQSVEHRGDVTYPVYVEVENDVSRLRWGMTARVEIRLER